MPFIERKVKEREREKERARKKEGSDITPIGLSD